MMLNRRSGGLARIGSFNKVGTRMEAAQEEEEKIKRVQDSPSIPLNKALPWLSLHVPGKLSRQHTKQ